MDLLPTQLAELTRHILLAAFVIGVVFGAVAQRTHFCTMGAVSDAVIFGDWTRLRMWALAAGVAVLGFNLMVAFGWLEARQSNYAAPRLMWLSNMLGGLMFGFGMVLASGCGSKTLVRVGGGSLKALLVAMVMALAAAATLRGITAVLRVATVDRVGILLPTGQDLPSLLAAATSWPLPLVALCAGLLAGLALLGFALWTPQGRSREVLIGGLGIGATVVAMWAVSGRLGHLSEHPVTLEEVFLATHSRRMESLTFAAPMAHALDWLTLFSDRSEVLTLGVVSTFGVVVGSAVLALATGSFRWEGFAGVEDTAKHLLGALLMGVGGVVAVGCTIGQGLSGLSTLALGSVLALLAILAGAVAGVRWQAWWLERVR